MSATAEFDARQFDRDGYCICNSVLTTRECDDIVAHIEQMNQDTSRRRGGVRDLFQLESIRLLARHGRVRDSVDAALSSAAWAVRALLFDKTPESNRRVSWHQDTTIAVRQRADVPGYGP